MKNVLNKLFIVLGFFAFNPIFSQTLAEKIASAKTIYVAPLQYYQYYGLKGGPNVGTKPYSHTGEFTVGDVVSVTDPNISYKIVGEISADELSKVNQYVLTQLQNKWGADKVKAWPEDMKNKMGDFNEKEIDCDLYVIMKRAAWMEPLRLSMVSSSNPDVKPVIKAGTETIKLAIYAKEKAGKKGKKKASVMKNPYGDITITCSSSDNIDAAAAEFCTKANEQMQAKVEGMLGEFYSEIEKN